ncbi:MAG: SagB/ThcOx family dehydrogenase [Chloroflexi bacterium]|nr:SagB/ThcOx family dehydrogenase [Chloroflexota bacterium]
MLFKKYLDVSIIPLPLEMDPIEVSALEAISNDTLSSDVNDSLDLRTIARMLYYSAGVTKSIRYAGGEMRFRDAACTGALYHIELYVICGDLPGLPAGVYHYDPEESSLAVLRQGDYRPHLIQAAAGEESLAHAPVVFVYTDVIWRNAVKYQAREYRHAFWDSGTILANTLAMVSAHRLQTKLVLGFVDEAVSQLLGLDAIKEVPLALLPIGSGDGVPAKALSKVTELSFKTLPISDYEIDFPAIHEINKASSLKHKEEVIAWRNNVNKQDGEFPAQDLIPLEKYSQEEFPADAIETVIMRRGSTRRFARKSLTMQQLSTIIAKSTQGFPSDYMSPDDTSLSQLYLIVNSVEGLKQGAYVFHKEEHALELLELGDYRSTAGHLGLSQTLPADASVNIYFLTDLHRVLDRFGNRGYRATQLEASITAGRIYLAAYAQHLGATGLTFFDDDVVEFFSPHAKGKSVMFLILLGKRSKRV